jgi:4-amino-4-deoxy-L-arabinose transferase-like glycosyltransferase
MMLLSPAATVYSVQVNHNSLLMPFYAAVLCFGLSYLERRRSLDAIGLGLAAGLGMITKYEIVFALVPLVVLSVAIPRYRSVYRTFGAYGSALFGAAIVVPHMIWLSTHGWSSVERAVGAAPLASLWAAGISLWGVFWGSVAVLAVHATLLLVIRHRSGGLRMSSDPDRNRIARILMIAPAVALALGSLITGQFVKALWLLALTPSTVIGLALLFPRIDAGANPKGADLRRMGVIGSALILALYSLYLGAGLVIGRPSESYLADTRPLSRAVTEVWARHSNERLACVIIDERKIAASAVLWLSSRPDFVDLSAPSWSKPDQIEHCARTGGIAITGAGGARPAMDFPASCPESAQPLHIPTVFGTESGTWDAEIRYVAPAAPGSAAEHCPI